MAGIDDFRIIVPVPVVMIVVVMLVCGGGLRIAPGAPEHPERQAGDDDGGGELEVRLRGFRIPLAAIFQRDGGEEPDDEGVRKRRRKAQQHGLRDSAADRDDEGGHHRFRVAGLQPVQRAEQDGGGDEKPCVRGAVLQSLGKIGHGRSMPPYPLPGKR